MAKSAKKLVLITENLLMKKIAQIIDLWARWWLKR